MAAASFDAVDDPEARLREMPRSSMGVDAAEAGKSVMDQRNPIRAALDGRRRPAHEAAEARVVVGLVRRIRIKAVDGQRVVGGRGDGAERIRRLAVASQPEIAENGRPFEVKLEAAEVAVAVSGVGRPTFDPEEPEARPRPEVEPEPAVGFERGGRGWRTRFAKGNERRPVVLGKEPAPARAGVAPGDQRRQEFGRAIRRRIADHGHAAGQHEARNGCDGAANDALERGRGGMILGPRRQPRVGVEARDQQVVMGRALAQRAGSGEYPLRLADQYPAPQLGGARHSESQPEAEQAAAVVGEMVGRVVLAKVLEPLGDGVRVTGEAEGGLAGRRRQSVTGGEVEQIHASLGRRVRVPSPAVRHRREPFAPSVPERADPGRIDARAQKRQPCEAMGGEFRLDVVEPGLEQILRPARRKGDVGPGKGKLDRSLGRARPRFSGDERGALRRQGKQVF